MSWATFSREQHPQQKCKVPKHVGMQIGNLTLSHFSHLSSKNKKNHDATFSAVENLPLAEPLGRCQAGQKGRTGAWKQKRALWGAYVRSRAGTSQQRDLSISLFSCQGAPLLHCKQLLCCSLLQLPWTQKCLGPSGEEDNVLPARLTDTVLPVNTYLCLLACTVQSLQGPCYLVQEAGNAVPCAANPLVPLFATVLFFLGLLSHLCRLHPATDVKIIILIAEPVFTECAASVGWV